MVTSARRPVQSLTIAPVARGDTAAVLADVILPLVAQGLIVRRPRIMDLLDRMDGQRRAIRRLQMLDERYGRGPVPLGLPGRSMAMVLAAGDAHTILARTPEVFAADTPEKRAALERFEPHGVLVSPPPEREPRRRFNEAVLETARPVHRLAAAFIRTIDGELDELLRYAAGAGALTWGAFATAWWRIVRRIVLGDTARDDEPTTDALARLRADANWGPFAPHRRGVRERFLDRLAAYVARAEPGSLASRVAAGSAAPAVEAVHQIPQWLFAFDAAGMAAFRGLALLDGHPDVAARARAEATAGDEPAASPLPVLRATMLESLRLWPTTPAILRETTEDTTWQTGALPAGTGLVIFVPYFHRDGRHSAHADTFAPDLWAGDGEPDSILMPFSLGPAQCPGRNLVLLITSMLLARLLARAEMRQAHPRPLRADAALPATLSPFRLRFDVRLRPVSAAHPG